MSPCWSTRLSMHSGPPPSRRGCEERESHVVERGFSWEAVTASLRNLSLFSTGKLVEIRLPTPTPGDEGSRHMRQLAGRPADGNTVVIITPALTRKIAESAWASALATAGVWVETRLPGLAELPAVDRPALPRRRPQLRRRRAGPAGGPRGRQPAGRPAGDRQAGPAAPSRARR